MKNDSFVSEEREDTGLPQHQTPLGRCLCQIKLSGLPFLVNAEKGVVSTEVSGDPFPGDQEMLQKGSHKSWVTLPSTLRVLQLPQGISESNS